MNMNKLGIFLIASAVLLSACGQRSEELAVDGIGQVDANGNPIDPDSPSLGAALPDILDVRVISDVSNLDTGSIDVATITAYVLDEDNNSVSGEAVKFRSTGGALLSIDTETNENGEAQATLSLLQEFREQDIIVTVEAGTFSDDVLISATGTDLTVSGPDKVAFGGDVELNITLIAGDEEPISNQEVTFISAAGNTVTPSEAVTDLDGRVNVVVDTANGSDTITVQALDGTVVKTHSFELTENLLSFPASTFDAELPVSLFNDIEVTWTRSGQAVVGESLQFLTTAGQIISSSVVTTDIEGKATITITSSSAGSAEITVQGVNDSSAIASLNVEFIAVNPETISLTGSPTRVDTTGTSELRALIVDINGNPVKNMNVNFTSADLMGGQLSPASAVTDSQGIARTFFTAGNSPSETDDIEVVAEVAGTTIQDKLLMTVVKRVLNITLGTSGDIEIRPLGTQYANTFSATVTDGSGNTLEGAEVELSVQPIWYGKGFMTLVDEDGVERENSPDVDTWSADRWVKDSISVICGSEDTNGNRVLDTGEDNNFNGALDPQDPAALTAVAGDFATIVGGVLETDEDGTGHFQLLYPASNAEWARVVVTARAQDLGAEAVASLPITLRMPSSEAFDTINQPANAFSPYGIEADCTTTN